MIPFVYIFSFLGLLRAASSETIAGRAFLGCAQVQAATNRIYCYGGQTGYYQTYGRFTNPTPDHFFLDLEDFDYTAVGSAKNNWTTVNSSQGSSYLTPNSFHLVASILNKTKFILYGGSSSNNQVNSFMSAPVLMYDPSINTWSPLPTYGQYTIVGAITDLSASQSLWTWGGKINNTGYLAKNEIASMNYGRGVWSLANGDPTNGNVRLSHTATLATANNKIYIIGGFEGPQLTNINPPNADMLAVRWYDTMAQTWGVDRGSVSNGQSITARGFHTTTQIPGTMTFLVYGGSAFVNTTNVVNVDYAYLYDYSKFVYTPLDFKGDGPGRLSGHTAVLYQDNIFILFGFNEKYELQNNINVLDVSNSSQLVWRAATSPTLSQQTPPAGSNSTSSGDADSNANNGNRITKGTIAAIAACAVVFLVIVGAAMFYFCYHKRRNQFKMEGHMNMDYTNYMLPTAFSRPSKDDSHPLSGSSKAAGDESRPLSTTTTTATDVTKPYNDTHEQTRFTKLYSDMSDEHQFNKLHGHE